VVGAAASLGIRPEHIAVGEGGGLNVQGKVGLVERLGHETFIEMVTPAGHTLSALVGGGTLVDVAQGFKLHFQAEDCHLFGVDGQAYRRKVVPEIALQHLSLAA